MLCRDQFAVAGVGLGAICGSLNSLAGLLIMVPTSRSRSRNARASTLLKGSDGNRAATRQVFHVPSP